MKENVISSMIGDVLRSFMAGMLLPVVATDASARILRAVPQRAGRPFIVALVRTPLAAMAAAQAPV